MQSSPDSDTKPIVDVAPTWRATIEHYLVFPVLVGLWSGFSRLGTREFTVPEGHIYYWVVTAIPSWWCYTLASFLLAFALRPWRSPLWVVLSGGYFIGYIFLWTPLMPLRNALLEPFFAVQPTVPYVETPAWPFFHVVGQIGFGVLPWLLINLLHHRLMNVPKFGYLPQAPGRFAAVPAAKQPTAEPADSPLLPGIETTDLDGSLFAEKQVPAAILSRFHAPPGTRLVALTAQEHYTRVITSAGARLVLLRFSDAVREAAPTVGLQVHRSHWVALDSIVEFIRDGREGRLRLTTGESVPVSRSYVRDLQSQIGGNTPEAA